ncbi:MULTISPECIES: nuclear transport factor 2 family protein [unclassified Streptomyces]|uniref:nuclear transport factor 2 family protein n=1 Tax=unclassified Streptomyces TaxID=2593676 RepID=UPI0004AAF5E1|nr:MULTISPECIES: nuclear transport factor 2 family protein [unclassified Streptomyces]MCX4800152.1 nuclear transport factor 2 family protein [Streptomyces sp. NBC_01214]WSR15611.1 nuclear transport factor 2 family protein [Streptomyces sp. NBC_01207]WTA19531.1 nuclear transport factor 2 family protein [Streptomyces sp. NBC_00853]
MEPLKVVAQLWERIEARDWDGVAGLIAEDAVIEWPVSGERIVGRANFIAVNSDDGYADERSVELLRILADGNLVVTEVEIPQDHVVYRAVSLWTVRDGEIVGAREYWTSPGQDPAPRWRAGYVEPLVAD